jgi:hypothetical protein
MLVSNLYLGSIQNLIKNTPFFGKCNHYNCNPSLRNSHILLHHNRKGHSLSFKQVVEGSKRYTCCQKEIPALSGYKEENREGFSVLFNF